MSASAIRNAWNIHGRAAGYVALPADVVVAQARLETGGFTSDIYRENRNAFGMKMPTSRPTTAIGVNRGHAVYRTLEDSVRDYVLRQRNFGIDDGAPVPYMRATVASGYAADPNYIRKWAALLGAPIAVASGFGLIAGLLILWAYNSSEQ